MGRPKAAIGHHVEWPRAVAFVLSFSSCFGLSLSLSRCFCHGARGGKPLGQSARPPRLVGDLKLVGEEGFCRTPPPSLNPACLGSIEQH